MILGAILVQHTAWSGAASALGRLHAAGCLELERLAATDEIALQQLIRPAGTYRQKSRTIRAWVDVVTADGSLATWLAAPALRERLLAIPGIGPETADCVLVYAAGQPRFIADAYARRILGRLGLAAAAGYQAVQAQVEAALPADAGLLGEFHALLVAHGKALCRARPRCGACPLRADCPFGAQSAV